MSEYRPCAFGPECGALVHENWDFCDEHAHLEKRRTGCPGEYNAYCDVCDLQRDREREEV